MVACISNGVTSSVQHYYNVGRSSVPLDSSNPSIGLSDFKSTFDKGELTCSFNRLKRIDGNQRYYDLNNKHYVLFARGPLNGSKIFLL